MPVYFASARVGEVMLRRVGVSAAASVLLATVVTNPAAAQGSPTFRAWNGLSVSVGGGAAKTSAGVEAQSSNVDTIDLTFLSFPIVSFLGQATGSSAVGTDDWEGFGTLQLAYDKRFGNFVVGAMADYDFYPDKPAAAGSTDVDGSIGIEFLGFPVGSFPVSNYATLSSSVELKSVWSLGGRLGYVVAPNLMLYGLGGYTQAKLDGQVDLSYFDFATFGETSVSVQAPDRLHGFFLGAGGEVKVTDNVALRLEYRYANYSGESKSATISTGDDGCTCGPIGLSYAQTASVKGDFDAEIHSVRGALVLQLGQ